MAGVNVKPANPANTSGSGASPPGNGRSTTVLTVGAVLFGLAIVQIGVTYLLMPEPVDKPSSEKHAGREEKQPSDRGDSERDRAAGNFKEVPLGDFSFSNTSAMRNVITH